MDKSPDAFRTISEVAELLETPAHVLRFWESRFPQIKPVKRAGGRRYYRPADMALLVGIRRLLHDEGMTIRGVQKILREQGVRHVSGLSEEEEANLADEFEELEAEEAILSTEPIALFPSRPQMQNRPLREVAAPEAEIEAALPDMGTTPEVPVELPAPEVPALRDHAADDRLPDPDTPPPSYIADGLFAGLGIDTGPARPAMPTASPERRATPKIPAPELPFDLPEPAAGIEAIGTDQPATQQDESLMEMPEAALPPEEVEAAEIGLNDEDVATPEPLSPEAAFAAESGPEDPSQDAPTPELQQEPAPLAAHPSADRPTPPPKQADPDQPITAHWLPADLRMLGKGALRGKTDAVAALAQRLEALRNRVGDLGRVPRR